ncbi:MAG: 30S ribosomal protein S20 [Chloroflexi bacterium]|nr:30S ribosomal protein S20 [Chloroflexota bacterium]
MPKLSSAQKTTKASEKKRQVNQPVKSEIKTLVSRAEASIKAGKPEAAQMVSKAAVALDRAATRKVLHANNAARRKSRLMKKLNAAAGAEAPEKAKAAPARKAKAA